MIETIGLFLISLFAGIGFVVSVSVVTAAISLAVERLDNGE